MTLINSNSKETNFIVELKPQEGFGPFRWQQMFAMPTTYPLIYTNVPKDIDEYVVRRLILCLEQYLWYSHINNKQDGSYSLEEIMKFYGFQTDASQLSDTLSGSILILIGTRGNKRVIIIDSDNDGDFGNEKIFEYEYPLTFEEQIETRYSLPVVSTLFQYVENGQIRKRKINIRPFPYGSGTTMHFEGVINPEIQEKYQLFFNIPEHRKGKMRVNGVDFDVFVSNGFETVKYYMRGNDFQLGTSVFINPKSTPILPESSSNIPLGIGDIFNIAGHDYLIDSISRWGDQLFIRHIGKNERTTGFTEDFYLPNFTAKYLDGTAFDLEKYSGKYVLFNFWATWCGPCIAKIPDLKKLNSELSGKNFVLINVAFDRCSEAVANFVAEQNMDWPQIFVNQRGRDENSLVSRLRVTGFPTMILISPERKIINRGWDIGREELYRLTTIQ